jgi:CHAT domain-containing protein
VATFWDIQDATAGEFFLDFHRRVAAGVPPATALAEVQRRFIESTDPSQRRPSQWAWAVIVGTIQTSSIS